MRPQFFLSSHTIRSYHFSPSEQKNSPKKKTIKEWILKKISQKFFLLSIDKNIFVISCSLYSL